MVNMVKGYNFMIGMRVLGKDRDDARENLKKQINITRKDFPNDVIEDVY